MKHGLDQLKELFPDHLLDVLDDLGIPIEKVNSGYLDVLMYLCDAIYGSLDKIKDEIEGYEPKEAIRLIELEMGDFPRRDNAWLKAMEEAVEEES